MWWNTNSSIENCDDNTWGQTLRLIDELCDLMVCENVLMMVGRNSSSSGLFSIIIQNIWSESNGVCASRTQPCLVCYVNGGKNSRHIYLLCCYWHLCNTNCHSGMMRILWALNRQRWWRLEESLLYLCINSAPIVIHMTQLAFSHTHPCIQLIPPYTHIYTYRNSHTHSQKQTNRKKILLI